MNLSSALHTKLCDSDRLGDRVTNDAPRQHVAFDDPHSSNTWPAVKALYGIYMDGTSYNPDDLKWFDTNARRSGTIQTTPTHQTTTLSTWRPLRPTGSRGAAHPRVRPAPHNTFSSLPIPPFSYLDPCHSIHHLASRRVEVVNLNKFTQNPPCPRHDYLASTSPCCSWCYPNSSSSPISSYRCAFFAIAHLAERTTWGLLWYSTC